MKPEQLRLIADIIEFNMPCRYRHPSDNGGAWKNANGAPQVPHEIAHQYEIELAPGDGYEFVNYRDAIQTDEEYTQSCGWLPKGASSREPGKIYRRKLTIHPPFGDAPEGYAWWNPYNLTPEQIETADGWRLCCAEEFCGIPHQRFSTGGAKLWTDSSAVNGARFKNHNSTYRTKAPLPMTERQRFDVWHQASNWWNNAPYSAMLEAWKAAKADKP